MTREIALTAGRPGWRIGIWSGGHIRSVGAWDIGIARTRGEK
jgi:hypothetical protein